MRPNIKILFATFAVLLIVVAPVVAVNLYRDPALAEKESPFRTAENGAKFNAELLKAAGVFVGTDAVKQEELAVSTCFDPYVRYNYYRYENDKYRDTNPVCYIGLDKVTGMVRGRTLAGGNILNRAIEVSNDLDPTSTPVVMYLRPDDTFDDRWIPGHFTIKLLDGNGGQPEYAHVTVNAGQESNFQFIGHACSPQAGPITT